MSSPRSVVFVCLHGAAKSVLAAAYCQRLADRRGLALRATCAGLEPDPAVSAIAAAGLLAEGIDVRGLRQRRVTREELADAWRVITLGCELGELVPPGVAVEQWDDVPVVSDGFAAARDALAARLPNLLDELA